MGDVTSIDRRLGRVLSLEDKVGKQGDDHRCVRCNQKWRKDHKCPDRGGFVEPMWASIQLPLELVIHCPNCQHPHVDKGLWKVRLHKTHLCESCRCEFRPCAIPTVGVAELPEGGDQELINRRKTAKKPR